jgi:hypothetical protein
MLSDPAYAYGVNLLPAERVADEVMRLNTQIAQDVRAAGATFTLNALDRRFQALLKRLEEPGICRRGEDVPPIISKELWLQAQWATIQKPARGDEL